MYLETDDFTRVKVARRVTVIGSEMKCILPISNDFAMPTRRRGIRHHSPQQRNDEKLSRILHPGDDGKTLLVCLVVFW